MKYYKILKNNVLVGIGFAKKSFESKTFSFVEISKKEYNLLDKKEFNGK